MSDEDPLAHGLCVLIEQGGQIQVRKPRPGTASYAFADHGQLTVWRMASLAFLQAQLPRQSVLTAPVLELFSRAGYRTESSLREMIAHLEGLRQSRVDGFLKTAAEEAASNAHAVSGSATRDGRALLRRLCERFDAVAHQIRHRHGDRSTLDVADEYDVQDLVHALLKIDFDDVREEDPCPTAAGASSRVDFHLPSIRTLLELKHTRDGLTAKKLGEELAIDIERYRSQYDCDLLLCFVYDPGGRIHNPAELETSLSGDKGAGRTVEVIIRPRR